MEFGKMKRLAASLQPRQSTIDGAVYLEFSKNFGQIRSNEMLYPLIYKKVVSSIHLGEFHTDAIVSLISTGSLKNTKCLYFEADLKSDQIAELILEGSERDVLYWFHFSHTEQTNFFIYCGQHDILQQFAEIDTLLKELESSIVSRGKGRIYALFRGEYGVCMNKLEFQFKALEIETHYPDHILPFEAMMVKKLRGKNPGFFLLHGPPGTGKTTFIKHLISKLDLPFMYIPEQIASNLTAPDLLGEMVNHPNAVLIIEDAEKVLSKRVGGGESPVSAILNMSDGLLGSVLNQKIICTVNNRLTTLDEALMRKGRLHGMCEFGLLPPDKANQLRATLGKEAKYTKPVSLAEIYGDDVVAYDAGVTTENTVGFKKG